MFSVVFTFSLLRGWEPSLWFPKAHLHPSPTPKSRCSQWLGFRYSFPIDTFITVGHIQKIVFLVVVLIQLAHGSTGGRDGVVDKEE